MLRYNIATIERENVDYCFRPHSFIVLPYVSLVVIKEGSANICSKNGRLCWYSKSTFKKVT